MKVAGYFVMLILLASCIDLFRGKVTTERIIVADGMITDQPGPYLVKLSYTKDIGDYSPVVPWITGAQLTLTDDAGNSDVLTEVSPGNYYTTFIQGVVGRTYKLTILMADTEAYESVPEKLLPVGEINDLHYDFLLVEPYIQPQDPFSYGTFTSPNGFNVKLDAGILPEQEGRVRWRWSGTFEILTHPETLVHPPDCTYNFGRCTCCHCWVTQHNRKPMLGKYRQESEIKDKSIVLVPAVQRAFYNRYVLMVDQMSLSQNAYDFYNQVATAESGGDNLFQVPPEATVGNIKALTPGATRIIGVFGASSIRSRMLEFHQEDIPYRMVTEFISQPCTVLYFPDSRNIKPDYY